MSLVYYLGFFLGLSGFGVAAGAGVMTALRRGDQQTVWIWMFALGCSLVTLGCRLLLVSR